MEDDKERESPPRPNKERLKFLEEHLIEFAEFTSKYKCEDLSEGQLLEAVWNGIIQLTELQGEYYD